MSDHDEVVSDTGYVTPVPELDDHRHQTASIQRSDRPRRGTFDSLYGGANQAEQALQANLGDQNIRRRDFEEAVVDEDDGDVSPIPKRSRRPTVDSTNAGQRDVSPPNSVKAFAQARRRERDLSVSEVRNAERLDRSASRASVYSNKSAARPVENECYGFVSPVIKMDDEDVCFPVPEERSKDKLYIDFEALEAFMLSDAALTRANSVGKVFNDLRQQGNGPVLASAMVTVDGDVLHASSDGSGFNEKTMAKAGDSVKPPAIPDKNRFSFFSSSWESTIHAVQFGDLVLPGESLRGLFTTSDDDPNGVWWLNMNCPTKDEVYNICKAFGVHPLTIEDITTQEAREKIELFPAYYFASFRSFTIVEDKDGPEYEPFNVYVVVFREGTLSFSFAENSHASQVRRRIAALKDYVDLSSDWICYAIIDNIVDSFAPVIRKIENEAEIIDDEVFVARPDDMHSFLRKVGMVRRNVMGLMRLIGGKADVLKGFTKRCNENYKVTPRMDIGLYLGDIQDHVVTMMNSLGHFEKILSRAHSNYLGQLTIDNISQSTKVNSLLNKVTIIVSILVPMNLVCGLFGMNVQVPFRDVTNLTPFFSIVGTFFGVGILLLLFLKWRKWL